MNLGKVDPQNIEPALTRERLELETRVLAAALRQSLERGDTEGSNLAHEQIFQLIKVSQELNFNEPVNFPREFNQASQVRPKSALPDIDWGAAEDFEPEPGEISPAVPEAFPLSRAQSYLDLGESPRLDESSLGNEQVSLGQPAQTEALEFGVDSSPLPEIAGADRADIVGNTAENFSGSQEPVSFSPEAQGNPLFDFMAIWSNSKQASQEENSLPQAAVPLDELPKVEPKTFAESSLELVLKVTDPSLTALTATTNSPGSLYELLAVSENADGRTIHRHCLVKIRAMLRHPENFRGPNRRAAHRQLQEVWIARDILCDPATRADYDFRRLGLRGAELEEAAKNVPSFAHADKSKIRIGELLLCAELLEQTELEIAADMHKAMPEMLFGAFLVKQEFIAESDLDCVLLSQQLIRTGKLTIAQFKEVMDERREQEKDISDILLDRALVTSDELLEAYRAQSEDTLVRVPVVSNKSVQLSLNQRNQQVVDSVLPPTLPEEGVPQAEPTAPAAEALAEVNEAAAGIDLEEKSAPELSAGAQEIKVKPNLAISYAAPAWKDQLDWSMEPEEENLTPVEELAAEQSAYALEYTEAPEDLEKDLKKESATGEDTVEIDALPADLNFGALVNSGEMDVHPASALSGEEPSFAEEAPVEDFGPRSAESTQELDVLPPAFSFGSPEEASAIHALWEVKIPQALSGQVDLPAEDNLDEGESVEEEFAMLEAAAQEALGTQFETSAHIAALSQEAVEGPAKAAPKEKKEAAGADKEKPYSGIPLSVQMEQASAGSGNWQIVSLPVDALASILLDEPELVEEPKAEPAPVKENTENSGFKKSKNKNKKRR